jgi:hypothetical protein
MIKVEVKKVWYNHKVQKAVVSVRNYAYKKALRKKESLGITFNKQFMIVPVEDLVAKRILSTECTSIFDGKKYRLIDFVWNPYKQKDNRQGKLFREAEND